jgi:hypothetical protein
MLGLSDDGTQEVSKHVGDCVSIVFTFQHVQGWLATANPLYPFHYTIIALFWNRDRH